MSLYSARAQAGRELLNVTCGQSFAEAAQRPEDGLICFQLVRLFLLESPHDFGKLGLDKERGARNVVRSGAREALKEMEKN